MEENEKKSSLFESHGVLEFLREREGVCVCVQKSKGNEGGKERALVAQRVRPKLQ